MDYYLICHDKMIKWNGKKINTCFIVPHIEKVLAQYTKPDGIKPKRVDIIDDASFIVRIDNDIEGGRYIEDLTIIEPRLFKENKKKNKNDTLDEFELFFSEQPLSKEKENKKENGNEKENKTELKMPVIFINFTQANMLPFYSWLYTDKTYNHIMAELHLSYHKIGNFSNILQTENETLTTFMKTIGGGNIIFTPMPMPDYKMLYWLLGCVGILLFAFILYKLYKKYRKQSQ